MLCIVVSRLTFVLEEKPVRVLFRNSLGLTVVVHGGVELDELCVVWEVLGLALVLGAPKCEAVYWTLTTAERWNAAGEHTVRVIGHTDPLLQSSQGKA